MTRVFYIRDIKPPYAQWFVEIDLTRFLAGETISSVNFSAIDTSDNSDATSVIMDPVKNTHTDSIIKPFIRGGAAGKTYKIKMQVTTNTDTKDEFFLNVQVGNY